MAEHGQWPNTEQSRELRKYRNNELFDAIIDDLIYNNHPKVAEILFFLYELQPDTINSVTESMQLAVNRAETHQKLSDFSIMPANNSGGLTFMAFYEWSTDAQYRAQVYPALRKYMCKADRWLTLVTTLDMPGLINSVIYDDTPWEYDHELESVSQLFSGSLADRDSN